MDLLQAFSSARHSAPRSGHGPLGSESYRPYREAKIDSDEWLVGDQGVELSFFLFQVEPLRFTLEGEIKTNSTVRFQLNQRPLKELSLESGAQVIDLKLDPEQLQPGLNRLTIEPGPTRWHHLLMEPRYPGLSSTSGRMLKPQMAREAGLLLPFEQTLEYPISPGSAAELVLQAEPWVESGIAEMAEGDWELQISWYENAPDSKVVHTVKLPGRAQLTLPARKGATVLGLTARHKGERGPFPGQAGLEISQLVLQRSTASTRPESESTPPRWEGDLLIFGSYRYRAHPPTLFLADQPQHNLILERPATALHLDSLWQRMRSQDTLTVEQQTQLQEDLRSLQYL